MNVIIANDYDDMSKRAAQIIIEQINEKKDSVIGLATGSTPEGLYQELIKQYMDGNVDFSDVRVFNLDEYVGLDGNDSQSYTFYMREKLYQKVNLALENAHIPNGKAADLKSECDHYEQLISELGGVDLQILGIGENGHIGFNEPKDSFLRKTHIVELHETTVQANARYFDDELKVPKRAITMGIGTIMAARKIILLAYGESKGHALHSAICGEITPSLPASVLQLHPNVTVIANKDILK